MARRQFGRSFAVSFLAAAAMLGYDAAPSQSSARRTSPVTHSSSYANPSDHARFKEALRTAAIPFETYTGDEGREYLRWADEHNAKVEEIRVALFGTAPPAGRSISFDAPRQEQFKRWLRENNIEYTTTVHHGIEDVVWAEADSPRVERWEHFPPYYRRMLKSSSNPCGSRGAPKSVALRFPSRFARRRRLTWNVGHLV
jgi:hypothetical protein